jgi:hypothetical protein
MSDGTTDELTLAARAVVYQRDYCAEHGEYDASTFHPDADQCFDDWAADILEAALRTIGHLGADENIYPQRP